MSRIENLQNKINKSNERLSEWEEKRDLSENPNVKANCNIEIKRIKIQIEKYNKELEKLTNINSNSSIQSDFESEKEFKIKFGTFIILFILTPIVYLAIAWLGKGIIKDDTIDFIIHWLFPLPIIVLYFMVMKSEAKIKREKYEFRGKASGAFAAAIIIYLLSFIPRSNNSEPFDLTITIKSNDKEVYDNFNDKTLKVFFDNYKENPNADYNKNGNHFEVEDIPPKYIEDSVSFQLNYNGYYIVDRNNILIDENKKYSVNKKINLKIEKLIELGGIRLENCNDYIGDTVVFSNNSEELIGIVHKDCSIVLLKPVSKSKLDKNYSVKIRKKDKTINLDAVKLKENEETYVSGKNIKDKTKDVVPSVKQGDLNEIKIKVKSVKTLSNKIIDSFNTKKNYDNNDHIDAIISEINSEIELLDLNYKNFEKGIIDTDTMKKYIKEIKDRINNKLL